MNYPAKPNTNHQKGLDINGNTSGNGWSMAEVYPSQSRERGLVRTSGRGRGPPGVGPSLEIGRRHPGGAYDMATGGTYGMASDDEDDDPVKSAGFQYPDDDDDPQRSMGVSSMVMESSGGGEEKSDEHYHAQNRSAEDFEDKYRSVNEVAVDSYDDVKRAATDVYYRGPTGAGMNFGAPIQAPHMVVAKAMDLTPQRGSPGIYATGYATGLQRSGHGYDQLRPADAMLGLKLQQFGDNAFLEKQLSQAFLKKQQAAFATATQYDDSAEEETDASSMMGEEEEVYNSDGIRELPSNPWERNYRRDSTFRSAKGGKQTVDDIKAALVNVRQTNATMSMGARGLTWISARSEHTALSSRGSCTTRGAFRIRNQHIQRRHGDMGGIQELEQRRSLFASVRDAVPRAHQDPLRVEDHHWTGRSLVPDVQCNDTDDRGDPRRRRCISGSKSWARGPS